jgi:hypothetical protein
VRCRPQVNGNTPDETYWQATGLYAMPGNVVTVTLPQALLASGAVRLQIGGWTDALWDHTDWARLPEVVRRCA